MIRDLSVGASVCVLVDDPLCGRILLDCGAGVLTAAAFAGVSLAGVTDVLFSASNPSCRDPSVEFPSGLNVYGPGALRPSNDDRFRSLPVGADEWAWLVTTSHGALLHCPSPVPIPLEAVAMLPPEFSLSVPLSELVRAQLDGFIIRAPRANMRVLYTGGARSGKSHLAEQRLRGRADVLYVATGPTPGPDDLEWAARVRLHQQRRPSAWRTSETQDLKSELNAPESAAVLIDCLGTWLTAAMDDVGVWTDAPGAQEALAQRVSALVRAVDQTQRDVVVVTNEVGSGVVPATSSGRRFRDELGRLNAAAAAMCDEVWLVTAGIGQRLR